jgi:hypothetical protein
MTNENGDESMEARVEVELDIFSGAPNPTWVLTSAEADVFVRRLAALTRISARKRPEALGYRGLIVLLRQGADAQLIRIQNGAVHFSNGATNFYSYDRDRDLERWLLNTGKGRLKNELFQAVEREFR